MNNYIYIDPKTKKKIKLIHIINKVNKTNSFFNITDGKTYEDILVKFLLCLVNKKNLYIGKEFSKKSLKYKNKNLLPNKISELSSTLNSFSSATKVFMLSSGTTGRKKKITCNWGQITRNISINKKYNNNIWALAYSPNHYAGIQVILQSFLNYNLLINVFNFEIKNIWKILKKYKITNISGTPTFYRKLLLVQKKNNYIKRISMGGEISNKILFLNLKKKFPLAKILNIYASTEAGTTLASKNNEFRIPSVLKSVIKIQANKLMIHKSLIAKNLKNQLDNNWYDTKDRVKKIKKDKFIFTGRETISINIGGYKVNPEEVENVLNSHPIVLESKAYSRKNSFFGNILLADVVMKKNKYKINYKNKIMSFLKKKLLKWKIPIDIYIVDKIDKTISGKIKR